MTIHFPNSVVKITEKGDQVLSSYLDKGEKLVDGRDYAKVAEDLQIQTEGGVSSVEQRPNEGSDAKGTDKKSDAGTENKSSGNPTKPTGSDAK